MGQTDQSAPFDLVPRVRARRRLIQYHRWGPLLQLAAGRQDQTGLLDQMAQ